jgi:putative restriction endonuclease
MPKRWTKEQTIVVFNLYCKIPFRKASSTHPDIIRIAKLIGRSPNSVKMKIGNFGSFDPELKKRGIVGLSNTSKLDEEVWNEFNDNWDELAYESEQLIAEFSEEELERSSKNNLEDIPEGEERETIIKARVNQNFFRQSVLSAYNLKCCITGIQIPQLLVASHIKPWSRCNNKTEKTNPRNGLCLNSLHDKAFDSGLITITPNFKIKVSKQKFADDSSKIINDWFRNINGEKIEVPERFLPEISFLEYHNSEVFKN